VNGFTRWIALGVLALGIAGCGGSSDRDASDAVSDAGNPAGAAGAKIDLSSLTAVDAKAGYGAPRADGRRLYAVVMRGDPAAAYKGGIAGFAKTRPEAGARFNAKSAAARAYREHLKARQDGVLQSVGGGVAVYHYTVAVNGFAAWLTPTQASALRSHGLVLTVSENRFLKPTTNNSGDFIGLNKEGKGLHAAGFEGEDIVVGILDTGIWPENPSFADDGSFGPPPPQWNVAPNEPGSCQFGNEAWNATDAPFACNNKLLAARNYNAAFDGQAGLIPGATYDSARDDDGHGSHTAGTAAGNEAVAASIGGQAIGEVSGVAPRARIAVYKVCHNGNAGGCGSVDSAAAIDQAVADGVDVINFSIGGPDIFFGGPEDIAFLFAKDAGVFVVTSAGNDGPGEATIGTPAGLPWVTTVGATQDDDVHNQGVGISRPDAIRGLYEGIEGTSPVTIASLGVVAGSLMRPGDPANFEGCAPWSNDATGYIALVSRGACSFAQKSINAEAAGARMMYVYNNQPEGAIRMGGLEAATIPSLMVENGTGALWRAQLDAGREVRSRVDAGETINKRYTMGPYSARGPNGGMINVLKPDVSAPGTDIQAAVTPHPIDGLYPGGAPGDIFGTLSGTSMASPHVAGLGALILQRGRSLTPGQVKSFIMTKTRRGLYDTWGDEITWLDSGTGQVSGFSRGPGLVADTDLFDDVATLCGEPEQAGIVDPAFCADLEAAGYSTDARHYNIPSIANSKLVGGWSTVRTFVNYRKTSETFTTNVTRVPGFRTTVSPSAFTVDPGQTVELTFSFRNNGAPTGEWRFGQVFFRNVNGGLQGRIPISLRADDFEASGEVSVLGAGESGSGSYEVAFGFDGEFAATGSGLYPAVRTEGEVVDDPANDINTALQTGVGVTVHTITVPPDALLSRFSLFDEFTDGNDDLDLYVFDPSGALVGSSGGGTSLEEVDLENPAPGDYFVVVHGWQTDGPDARYTLFDWQVTPGGPGNLTVTGPAGAINGTSATVEYAWSGLAADEKYLGLIQHAGSIALPSTIVNVSTE
jgi:subtilisin family serine protease